MPRCSVALGCRCRLLDYLEADERVDDFLSDFPTVSREQAIAVLELARAALTSDARPVR